MTLRLNPVHSVSQDSAIVQPSHSNRIKKLPPLLVNQLAAGEVVTRPASVVKELVENAIDAGAKTIEIRITQGGMGIIEVADDGCGIHPDDMVMAVTRFATSKIADVAHLQGIATLGFRGEALAATAAVSRLTLKSSADSNGVGRELNVAGILEDTPALTPVVHPQGTTVTVKDLYFNVPARRGNLKSISTEYAHIESVVKQLALVASDITFTLWHNDKRRFHFEAVKANGLSQAVNTQVLYNQTSSNNSNSTTSSDSGLIKSHMMQSVLARLQSILSSWHAQSGLLDDNKLQSLFIDLEGLRPKSALSAQNTQPLGIFGLLIPSTNSTINTPSSYKLIYINGRLVKDRRIAQSMRDSVGEGQQLGYVLFFNLPTAWLNLNVHPSKQCIKIQNLANIMAHLEVGVRDALQSWNKRQPKPSQNQNTSKDNKGADLQQRQSQSQTLALTGRFDASKVPVINERFPDNRSYDQSPNDSNQHNKNLVNEPLVNYQNSLAIADALPKETSEPESWGSLVQTEALPSLPLYRCLYLLDLTDIDSDLLENLPQDDRGQNKLSRLVLLQQNDMLWLCTDFHLIEALGHDNESVEQVMGSYEQCDETNRLAWLNQSMHHRLMACNDSDDVSRLQALIQQKAAAKLTLQEMMKIMLEQGK